MCVRKQLIFQESSSWKLRGYVCWTKSGLLQDTLEDRRHHGFPLWFIAVTILSKQITKSIVELTTHWSSGDSLLLSLGFFVGGASASFGRLSHQSEYLKASNHVGVCHAGKQLTCTFSLEQQLASQSVGQEPSAFLIPGVFYRLKIQLVLFLGISTPTFDISQFMVFNHFK